MAEDIVVNKLLLDRAMLGTPYCFHQFKQIAFSGGIVRLEVLKHNVEEIEYLTNMFWLPDAELSFLTSYC